MMRLNEIMMPAFSALLAGLALAGSTSVRAEMLLSQIVVDVRPDKPPRDDIEVWNDGDERMFVLVEPSQIEFAGTLAERRVVTTDPAVSGILVSPQRLILEPGQRRMVRIATILPSARADRIYRVVIKPVSGSAASEVDALKVLVGYDVLVIQRPGRIAGDLRAARENRAMSIHNESNTALELFGGKQCDAQQAHCVDLPAKRLYADATWAFTLPYATPATYQVTDGVHTYARQF